MILNIYPHLDNISNGISSVLKNLATDKQINNHKLLKSDILDEKINAVVLHGCYSFKHPFQIFFCKIKKKRVYWMPHGGLQKNSLAKSKIKKTIYHNIISRFCIRFSHGTIFTSIGEKKRSEWILKNNNYKIIYNSIPKNNISTNSKEDISYIGRIDGFNKGIDRFGQWLSDYSRPINMYGPIQDASFKSSKNIIFHGEVEHSKVKEILAHTKVFIILSRSEGLPISALEAFSAGCIIICTEECNLNEFIEKYRCGFIVKNKEDVISALDFIFDPKNFKTTLEMSKKSTLLAHECFSLEKQILDFIAL